MRTREFAKDVLRVFIGDVFFDQLPDLSRRMSAALFRKMSRQTTGARDDRNTAHRLRLQSYLKQQRGNGASRIDGDMAPRDTIKLRAQYAAATQYSARRNRLRWRWQKAAPASDRRAYETGDRNLAKLARRPR